MNHPLPGTVSIQFCSQPAGADGHRVADMVMAANEITTETDRFGFRRERVQDSMIMFGLIFLLLGAVLAIPILWTIGIILVVVGLVLMLLGRSGHQVGSRAHYW